MLLDEKEKIIFRVHPHWLYVAIPEFTLAILGLIFLNLAYWLPLWLLTLFIGALAFAMLFFFLD